MERPQSDALPLGLVAKRAGGFVGAIAIAANAITPRQELSPCLIGLWVAPAHRRKGIGPALLRNAIVKAAELGFDIVYNATTKVPGLFVHAGWEKIDRLNFKGDAFLIFAAKCRQA